MDNVTRFLLSPPGLADYTAYFKTLLSVSGVLFGLAFAGLLFVIQSGFASFKFSRRMFLEIYVHFGRSLLYSLAYLTLLPIVLLYFAEYRMLLSVGYYGFAAIYTKSLLDHYRQLGYVHTIFSSAFVPRSYGPVRRYFRYIRNLGCAPTVGLIVLWFISVAYPVLLSYAEGQALQLSTRAFFYSSIFILIHTVLRITNFIPEFFRLSNLELDYAEDPLSKRDSAHEQAKIRYSTEKRVLRKFLADHGVKEIDPTYKIEFLDGELTLHFLDDREGAEAWFNVFIDVENPTNVEIRDAVCSYAVQLFKVLDDSKVDLNTFVLSFHVKIKGDKKHRNIFFRTNRSELSGVLEHAGDPVKATSLIENRLFDELFRDL